MRHPARTAFSCFLVLVLAAASFRWGLGPERAGGEKGIAIVPALVGLGAAPFALVILIQALFAIRGRTRLLRGEGVIARWTLSPDEWERFRRLETRRPARDDQPGNDLRISDRARSTPVQIIVGRKSALVDGSYHSLNPRGLPELRGVRRIEGPPACLEFALLHPRSRYGGPVPATVRIPVAAGASADAGRVIAYFEPLLRNTPPLAAGLSTGTGFIRFLIILAGAIVAGSAYGFANHFLWGADDLLTMSLVIGGTIVAVFALLLALATWLFARRS